jgi:hypothetical protein
MRYWKRVDEHNRVTTVESYSYSDEVEGAIEITKKSFDNYIASLKPLVLPVVRDLAAEIDAIKHDLAVIIERLDTL